MADKFRVKVPVDLGGSTAAAGATAFGGKGDNGSEGRKNLTTKVKDLTKSIVEGNLITKALTDVFSGVRKLLEPLVRVLSALFIVMFLDFIPILKSLTEGIGKLVKNIAGEGGGATGLVKGMEKTAEEAMQGMSSWKRVLLAVLAAGAIAIMAAFAPITVVLAAIGALLILAWDGLKFSFWWLVEKIASAADWVWEEIKSIGTWFKELPGKIWEGMKSAFEWLGDKIMSIWQILKKPFDWLSDGIKKMVNGVIKLINKVPGVNIPQLANGGVVTSPTLALIGEAGPEAVVPLNKMGKMGSTTVNINNPSVRNDSDIKKIVSEVSKHLQRENRRRFS